MLLSLQQFVILLDCTTPLHYLLILTYDDCNKKKIVEHEPFLVTKVIARIWQDTELNSFSLKSWDYHLLSSSNAMMEVVAWTLSVTKIESRSVCSFWHSESSCGDWIVSDKGCYLCKLIIRQETKSFNLAEQDRE